MPYLLARASQVVIEAQRLRQEGRALRHQAAISASELGQTIVRATATVGNANHVLEERSPAGEIDGPDKRAEAAR